MCGIVGFFEKRPDARAPVGKLLLSLLTPLGRRGPDSAGAALYTFLQPGLYVYLNHNLIDAVLKGAAAHVNVEGEWNNDLLEQIAKPGPTQ